LISTFLKARAYSSGHCPGFTPGSLLCPDFRQEITYSITASNILSYNVSFLMMKKKYSHHYERYFYKFIASNESWIRSTEIIRLSPDEKNYTAHCYTAGYQFYGWLYILLQGFQRDISRGKTATF
jgi:hypothetical protein